MSFTSFADIDVSQWLCGTRYSFEDVCVFLGIDINNRYTKFLLDIDLLSECIVDEFHLDMMGIMGRSYKEKQRKFKKLLLSNSEISYRCIKKNDRIYYVVNGWDFETLFRQIKSEQANEFRRQSKRLQYAFSKYWEYKALYHSYNKNLLV